MASSEMPEGPSEDDQGKYMRVDGAEFRTRDQLSKINRERLSKKGLKPIEIATFADVRACTRDHLRTYCGVYNMKRKEKDEMELDMARYVAAWHHGEPGYDISTYVPSKPVSQSTPTPPSLPSTRNAGANMSSSANSESPQLRSSLRNSFGSGNTDNSAASPAVGSKRPSSGSPPEVDPTLLKTAAARPETRNLKRARLTPPSVPIGKSSRRSSSAASSGDDADSPSSPSSAPKPRSTPPEMNLDANASSPSPLSPSRPGRGSASGADPSAASRAHGDAGDSASEAAGGGGESPGAESSSPQKGKDGEGASENAQAAEKKPSLVNKTRMIAVPPPRPVPAQLASNPQGSAPAGAVGSAGPAEAPRVPPPNPVRTQNTSFKQYAHAQQATARYKAAYSGGSSAIVQVVENAAAYFEGRDTSDVVLNKQVSLDRYRFNVDMLNEIFDCPCPSKDTDQAGGSGSGVGENASRNTGERECDKAGASEDQDGDAVMTGTTPVKSTEPTAVGEGGERDNRESTSADKLPSAEVGGAQSGIEGAPRQGDAPRQQALADEVLQRLGEGMKSRSNEERVRLLSNAEAEFRSISGKKEVTEMVPLRAFHKLDKARSPAEVRRACKEFENEHGISFVSGGKIVVQRKLSNAEPAYVPPTKLRIVKLG